MSSWRARAGGGRLIGGLLLLMLTSCSSAASEPGTETRTGGTPAAQTPKVSEVAIGLTSPWGLVALTDGSTLISERDTRRILHLAGGRVTPVRTIDDARAAGEGGLLGIAASQDQQTVFAYFTAENDNRLVSMTWNGQSLGTPTVILSGIPKGGVHNGGRLAIGPDGYLYIGTGETGDAGLAQDTKSLGGKILRITTAGRPAPGTLRQRGVQLRAPQCGRTGLRRRGTAVGQRIRRTDLGPAQPHHEGRQLRLAAGRRFLP